MSTDRELTQEAVEHNMTHVTSKESSPFIFQHSTILHSMHKENKQLFEVKDTTWNKSRSLSGCRCCSGQGFAFPEKKKEEEDEEAPT